MPSSHASKVRTTCWCDRLQAHDHIQGLQLTCFAAFRREGRASSFERLVLGPEHVWHVHLEPGHTCAIPKAIGGSQHSALAVVQPHLPYLSTQHTDGALTRRQVEAPRPAVHASAQEHDLLGALPHR